MTRKRRLTRDYWEFQAQLGPAKAGIADAIHRLEESVKKDDRRQGFADGMKAVTAAIDADFKQQRGAMRVFSPSQLPSTPAGRLEQVLAWLQPQPIYDDEGEPTGKYSEPIITLEQAVKLLDGPP